MIVKKEIKNCNNNYKVLDSYDAEDVASWLNQGLIIARCEGKMEFGQRALGNRSILADPRNDTVDKINTKIKYRDFWMPFTPTICYEDCELFSFIHQLTMAYDMKKNG